jgi:redox-sensitive bicupin YhaK (pirin superfamily)
LTVRLVSHVLKSKPTLEGAGVRVNRAFGGPDLAYLFDPFLLLDDFGSRYPHEYLQGFPWHPHRGIETITYLVKGEVHHEDSTGTRGVIKTGDLQWMTAGSGIFHSEMPKPEKKRVDDRDVVDPEVRGFQLWVNLPASDKMTDPKYRNLEGSNVPQAELDDGSRVKIVAGEIKRIPRLGSVKGPVSDSLVDVNYLDFDMVENTQLEYTVKDGYTAFAYVVDGEAYFDPKTQEPVGPKSVVLYNYDGDTIRIRTQESRARFLLVSGKPLNEPIAWYGPIVMNTNEQLMQALRDLQTGEFVKTKATSFDYIKY